MANTYPNAKTNLLHINLCKFKMFHVYTDSLISENKSKHEITLNKYGRELVMHYELRRLWKIYYM